MIFFAASGSRYQGTSMLNPDMLASASISRWK